MKAPSTNDLRDQFEDDRSSKNESFSAWARIVTAATLTLLPFIHFYPAAMGKIMLSPGDGWSQNLGIHILVGDRRQRL